MKSKHELKNGYVIARGCLYDEGGIRSLWCVYSPNGILYMAFNSYEEAYEIALNLIPEAN